MMVRALLLVAVGLLWGVAAAEEPGPVDLAKELPVSELSPELPRQPMAAWLRRLAGKGALFVWETIECGPVQKQPAPPCVQVQAQMQDGRQLFVAYTLPVRGGKTPTKAQLQWVSVADQNGLLRPLPDLAQLPAYLGRP